MERRKALEIGTTAVNWEDLHHLLDELLQDYQFLLRWMNRASEVSHHLTLFLFHDHFEARTVMTEQLVETLVMKLVVDKVVKLVANLKLIGLVEVEMVNRFSNS